MKIYMVPICGVILQIHFKSQKFFFPFVDFRQMTLDGIKKNFF